MKIALASDHAGFRHKEALANWLRSNGHEPIDFGTGSEEPCDYPDFCHPAAASVADGRADRGIVLGGSGNGEAMVANRHKGVRCALCYSVETAKLARMHNDANMISIGQRLTPIELAIEIVQTWLETEFEGGRHAPRLRKIDGNA